MTVKGDGKFGNLYGDLLDYLIPVDVMFYTLMVGAVAVMRWKAPRAGASLSNVRLSVAGDRLRRAGGFTGRRLHLARAEDLRRGVRHRTVRASRVSYLVPGFVVANPVVSASTWEWTP